MKKIVTILFILLFLFLRQGSQIIPGVKGKMDQSVFKEANLILSSPGLGWIEDSDYSDSKLMTPELIIFIDKEELLSHIELQKRLRFSLNIYSNPLLIDLPPPNSYS